MNIVFTCGGTAGHINPAIALANLCRKQQPDCNILFIGAEGGMETRLVPREGYELKTVKISGFQRQLTLKNIFFDIRAAWRMISSAFAVRKILREFRPDIIVGMGGYASYPALRQGARMGIPTVVHEANAMPGLTTRMIADHADRVMVAFEESVSAYHHPEKVVVVGMPVREEFVTGKKEEMKKRLGLEGRQVVLSCFGSLGARDMNRQMIDFICMEEKEKPGFVHFHVTGKAAWEWMPQKLKERGVDYESSPDLRLSDYCYNMTELLVASDVIISRAGASSLNEIAASGTPAIIIPSPNVTANHQEKNARVLEKRGGAIVLTETESSGALLYAKTKELLADPEHLEKMSELLRSGSIIDSAERIYAIMMSLVEEKTHA